MNNGNANRAYWLNNLAWILFFLLLLCYPSVSGQSQREEQAAEEDYTEGEFQELILNTQRKLKEKYGIIAELAYTGSEGARLDPEINKKFTAYATGDKQNWYDSQKFTVEYLVTTGEIRDTYWLTAHGGELTQYIKDNYGIEVYLLTDEDTYFNEDFTSYLEPAQAVKMFDYKEYQTISGSWIAYVDILSEMEVDRNTKAGIDTVQELANRINECVHLTGTHSDTIEVYKATDSNTAQHSIKSINIVTDGE